MNRGSAAQPRHERAGASNKVRAEDGVTHETV